MLCSKCNKNEATVQYTQIINGKKTEGYLCASCANLQNNFLNANDLFSMPISSFLKGIMGSTAFSKAAEPVCEKCNTSLSEFSRMGKFGCDNCYSAFSSEIEPLLRRIHGNTEHKGKVPGRSAGELKNKRRAENLRAELKRCIENEEYEKAAELRDEIRKIESEGGVA